MARRENETSRRNGSGDRPNRAPVDLVRRHLRAKLREADADGAGDKMPAAPSLVGIGYLDGRHFSTFIAEIEYLQEQKLFHQALALLRRLREAVDGYVTATGRNPETWCDEQIAATERAIVEFAEKQSAHTLQKVYSGPVSFDGPEK